MTASGTSLGQIERRFATGRLLAMLRAHWHVLAAAIAVSVAVATATTVMGGLSDTPSGPRVTEYTASYTLVLTQDGGSTQISLPLLARLATTGEVPTRVAEALGGESTPEQLAARVTVEADNVLGVLTLTTRGPDAGDVTTLVTTFADEILNYAGERNDALRTGAIEQTSTLVSNQQQRVRDLNVEIAQLDPASSTGQLLIAERDALLAAYTQNLQRLEVLQAQPPGDPGLTPLGQPIAVASATDPGAPSAATRGFSRVAVASLLGLVLGAGLVVVLDFLRPRVYTADDTEGIVGAPVLAEVVLPGSFRDPVVPVNGSLDHPSTAIEVNSWRRVAVTLLHAPIVAAARARDNGQSGHDADRQPARTILLTSPDTDASGYAVANVGASLSVLGHLVLVVDRSSGDPEAASEGPQHVNVTAAGATSEPVRISATAVPGLSVAREGQRARAGIRQLEVDAYLVHAERVVVDGGDLVENADGVSSIDQVDAILLVAVAGKTEERELSELARMLDSLRAPLAGAVLLRGGFKWQGLGGKGQFLGRSLLETYQNLARGQHPETPEGEEIVAVDAGEGAGRGGAESELEDPFLDEVTHDLATNEPAWPDDEPFDGTAPPRTDEPVSNEALRHVEGARPPTA